MFPVPKSQVGRNTHTPNCLIQTLSWLFDINEKLDLESWYERFHFQPNSMNMSICCVPNRSKTVLSESNPKVTYVPFGISGYEDLSKCKLPARRQYMEIVREYSPEFMVILDADEFNTHRGQIDSLSRGLGQLAPQ